MTGHETFILWPVKKLFLDANGNFGDPITLENFHKDIINKIEDNKAYLVVEKLEQLRKSVLNSPINVDFFKI